MNIKLRIVSFLIVVSVMGCQKSSVPTDHVHGPSCNHTDDSEQANMLEAREAIAKNNYWSELLGLTGSMGRNCSNAFGIKTPAPFRKVVLTFDDGPDGLTQGLLDTLKEHQIKATFFIVGQQAAKYRSIVSRIQREGHIIASHSWSHPRFPKTPEAEQLEQIDSTERELSKLMPQQKLFRFPYGWGTCPARDYLIQKKYGIVGWHVDSCDWGFNKTGTVDEKTAKGCGVSEANRSNYFQHVIDTIETAQGGIILFHDAFRDRTLPQIERIILELKARGYSFSNLDDPEFRESIWFE